MRARRRARPHVVHALQVAVVTTVLIASVYAAVCVVFDVIDGNHLAGQVDAHLRDRLVDATHHGVLNRSPGERDDDHEVESAPVLLWKVGAAGHTEALSDGAPLLPVSAWSTSGRPTTATLGATSFRLLATRVGSTWLVAGQSLSETTHVEYVLQTGEAIAGPVIVLAVFLGALIIGLKAAGPVEQARRRQLEFTADASHELRTPLTVIDAEVDLALSTPRTARHYQETLTRVARESQRLQRIVEDMLWLARFDSEPSAPVHESVDVTMIARACAERFEAIAQARGITLVGDTDVPGAQISGPPAWVDRLVGVLVDNACRYAGPDGTVHISVKVVGHRVALVVEDSGPGIAPDARPRLFDRFHRATDEGSGAGLGLAIADAVVRSTSGRWNVGESRLGGARMEVTWHRLQSRDPGPHSRARRSEAGTEGDVKRAMFTDPAGAPTSTTQV
jgi:signal transduction histidine kinase